MDEAKLAELIARGQITGALTFDEVNAAFPNVAEPEQLADLCDRLEAAGITIVEDDECDPPPAVGTTFSAPVDEGPPAPVLYRHAAFEQHLRSLGVAVEKCLCAFVIPEQIASSRLLLPGDQALRAWLRLRELADELGFRAVIRSKKVVPLHWDEAEAAGTAVALADAGAYFAEARKLIADADAVPPIPWQFRNANSKPRPSPDLEFADEDLPVSTPDLPALFSPEGPYRCVRVSYGPSDYPIVPHAEVVLVPTTVPWQVFAYQRFGGWNDCPWPDEQLSMLREWHTRYGAEVVSMGFDWYELFVPRPPRTRRDAERLGKEIRYFAEEYPFERPVNDDWVEAARTAHYWTFWWD